MGTSTYRSSGSNAYDTEMFGAQPTRSPVRGQDSPALESIAASHKSRQLPSNDEDPFYVRMLRKVFKPFGYIATTGVMLGGYVGKEAYLEEKPGKVHTHQEE